MSFGPRPWKSTTGKALLLCSSRPMPMGTGIGVVYCMTWRTTQAYRHMILRSPNLPSIIFLFPPPLTWFFFLASHFRFDPPFLCKQPNYRLASISTLIPYHPRLFSHSTRSLETQNDWPGEIGNVQSAASHANTPTPRVAASVSPKTLILLLLPPPPPLPPLRNRGQREDRRRGLLRHMPGSEPTRAHQDVRCMGRPQGGTRFHSVGPFLPFLTFVLCIPFWRVLLELG
jgi:hypothetical protein